MIRRLIAPVVEWLLDQLARLANWTLDPGFECFGCDGTGITKHHTPCPSCEGTGVSR